MGLVAAKCPACGANIQIPDDSDRCFCSYCGAQVLTEAAINFARVKVDGVVQTRSADFDIQAGILKGYHGASTDVVIPEGVHTIDPGAFKGLPITSVTLPASIKMVQFDVFRKIKTLRAMYYTNDGNDWTGYDGSLYSQTTREYLFYPPADPHENLTFSGVAKATISNNPYLKKLTIESSDCMPELVIDHCDALEQLVLPATGIKSLKLVSCPNIASIAFPNFVETIELDNCKSLARIDVLSALNRLNVSGCPLAQCNADDGIELPKGTISVNLSGIEAKRLLVRTGIQKLHVSDYYLAEFELEEGVERLDEFSVRGCGTMHVKLPGTLAYVNADAFNSYSVTFDFPNIDKATIFDDVLRSERQKYWHAHGRCYYCGGQMKGLVHRRCRECDKPEVEW